MTRTAEWWIERARDAKQELRTAEGRDVDGEARSFFGVDIETVIKSKFYKYIYIIYRMQVEIWLGIEIKSEDED